MTSSLSRVFVACLLLPLCAALPAQAQQGDDAPRDIVQTAKAAGNFTTLTAALKAAGLVNTLKGEGPFTVFAPTDEAFDALPEGTLESLLKPENKAQLQSILKYHVVSGKVMAGDVTSMSEAKTVQGALIEISTADGTVTLSGKNKATVTSTDIAASNGVIHVIDAVLMPPADEMASEE